MASTSIGKKQWDSTWAGLPAEIRLPILEALAQDGCTLSRLATVSREWQTELERYNFAQIRLTSKRLVDFGSMIHRNRALVRYIWFCFELDEYGCTRCAPVCTCEGVHLALSVCETDRSLITSAFRNLFSVLSTWEPLGDLKLDISVYSPSDSQHWFKYLRFVPDPPKEILGGGDIKQTMLNNVFHDPRHGWVAGSQISTPPTQAIRKLFDFIMFEYNLKRLEYRWWDQLPSVPAVTSLALRQQNHRRWEPSTLAHMFARFPRLEEVHYEPWREWNSLNVNPDRQYQHLFESISRCNNNLKRLVVFENFNQQYPAILQKFPVQLIDGTMTQCDSIRKPAPAPVLPNRTLLERPNLTSLALTSRLLTPDGKAAEIKAMLQSAAAAAMNMPQLETMEIWNGRKGIAGLFKYQASRERRRATITWRGTWEMTMEPSVIQAWEAIVQQFHAWRLNMVHEWLDGAAIKSHGDAIQYLKLSSQVVRPISLQQIQIEQEFMEGLTTV